MRYDYFIIWGNGIKYADQITYVIDMDTNFRIIYEIDMEIDDMAKFVEAIYSCDTVPLAHLKAKSKYLLKSEKKIRFLLTENKEPDEKMVGEGEFKHLQCQKVTALKTSIRNKYNPKWKEEKQVLPLDSGVSHDHVIHGSDYQSQVHYVLEYLKLNSISYFDKFAHDIDVRYFFAGMPKYCVLKQSMNFPNYNINEDVDILCEDINAVKKHILDRRGSYELRLIRDGKHHHIDIMMRGILNFRFDLIDIVGDEIFTNKVLETSVSFLGVQIPKLQYDLAIRYMEYLKYHKERPFKVKHAEYCKAFTNVDYKTIANEQISQY